ncbi:MAG: hypothetical protein L6Q40_01090 [Azonexus sp.]|nr:hypothetical protein [Azonexus sp.]
MKKQHLASARFASALVLGLLLGLTGCVSNQSKEEAPAAPQVAEKTSEPAPKAAPAAPEKPVCKETPKTSKKTAKSSKKTSKSKKAEAPAEVVDCEPAAAQSAAKPAAVVVQTAPAKGGYDLSKNKPVTDSTKAEAGQGTMVKGINEWQGEISGVPAANSRFTRLKIGMSQTQVTDIAGQPTDQGAYITGKAFIPFYFGSDKSRWEMVYKGQGRLIFSNQAGFGSGYYLTWIIHNANEGGYR